MGSVGWGERAQSWPSPCPNTKDIDWEPVFSSISMIFEVFKPIKILPLKKKNKKMFLVFENSLFRLEKEILKYLNLYRLLNFQKVLSEAVRFCVVRNSFNFLSNHFRSKLFRKRTLESPNFFSNFFNWSFCYFCQRIEMSRHCCSCIFEWSNSFGLGMKKLYWKFFLFDNY